MPQVVVTASAVTVVERLVEEVVVNTGCRSRLLAALSAAVLKSELEVDGAVVVLCYIINLFIEEFLAVGISVIECGSGFRGVAEHVVSLVREDVGSHSFLGIVTAAVSYLVLSLVVGKYWCHSLVVVAVGIIAGGGVYGIVVPQILVVVNVDNKKSFAGNIFVPS